MTWDWGSFSIGVIVGMLLLAAILVWLYLVIAGQIARGS